MHGQSKAMLTVLFICFSGLFPVYSQGLGDLFKKLGEEIGKQVEQKADQTLTNAVEEGCQGKDETARVNQIDYSHSSTYAILASDGTKYQVSNLQWAGSATDNNGNDASGIVNMAQTMQFTETSRGSLGTSYRVGCTYGDVAGQGAGGLGGILQNAINATASTRPANFNMSISRLSGTSLDGNEWCIPARLIRLESIQAIR